jgi:hypothetical protein
VTLGITVGTIAFWDELKALDFEDCWRFQAAMPTFWIASSVGSNDLG